MLLPPTAKKEAMLGRLVRILQAICTTFGHAALTHLLVLSYKVASWTERNKLHWQFQAAVQADI